MKLYVASEITFWETVSLRPPLKQVFSDAIEAARDFWNSHGIEEEVVDQTAIHPVTIRFFSQYYWWYHNPEVWHTFTMIHETLLQMGATPAVALWEAIQILTHSPAFLSLKAGAASAVGFAVSWTAVIVLGVLTVIYLINPERKDFVKRIYNEGRYVLRISQFIWFADLVGHTTSGRDIYVTCGAVPGFLANDRLSGIMGTKYYGNYWRFGGSWLEEWYDFPHYHTVEYLSMSVSFVGVCWNLGGGLYVLRLAHEDLFSGDIEDAKIDAGRETCSEPEYTQEITRVDL